MEFRLFLAFELPSDIMDSVYRISGEIKGYPLNVKWIKAGNIHLTIVFLGNIRADHIPIIEDATGNVCSRYGAFGLNLNGIGIFPNRAKPRVIWLGLDGDLERMSYFRNSLQKHLKLFNIKQEKRRFKPHLSLGRFRKGKVNNPLLENVLMRYKDTVSSKFILNELHLFKSDLRPTGSEYTKLKTWLLSGEK